MDNRVGLLGHKSLLVDYSNTLKQFDDARKNINRNGQTYDTVVIENESPDEEGITSSDKKWIGIQRGRKYGGESSEGGSGESEVSSSNGHHDEITN